MSSDELQVLARLKMSLVDWLIMGVQAQTPRNRYMVRMRIGSLKGVFRRSFGHFYDVSSLHGSLIATRNLNSWLD